MHLAEEDEFVSKSAQAEINTALAGKPNATVYSYLGQNHAFARHNGAHYNAAAAALANRGGNFRFWQAAGPQEASLADSCFAFDLRMLPLPSRRGTHGLDA
jgi:hypothetical protein